MIQEPQKINSLLVNALGVIDEVVLPKLKENTKHVNEIAKEVILNNKETNKKTDKIEKDVTKVQECVYEVENLHKDLVKSIEISIKSLNKNIKSTQGDTDKINVILQDIQNKVNLLESDEYFEYDDTELKDKCVQLSKDFEQLKKDTENKLTAEDFIKGINSKKGVIEASAIRGLIETISNISQNNSNIIVPNSMLSILNNGATFFEGAMRLNFTGATLINNGGTISIPVGGGGGSAITLQTNNVNNTSQTVLNLKAGSNITLVPDTVGGVVINSVAAGTGTVTNVSSATADATVINNTTTPVITIVSAPKLTTPRTINGVNFDGTANISVVDASKQPLDAGLTSVSGLTGTGYVKATATDVFTQVSSIPNTDITGLGTLSTQNGTFSGTSSGTNSGDQTITLTGDVIGSGTGSFATTLATVNTNVGSFGLAGSIAQFVVNAKGLITSAANVAISITASQVSNFSSAVNALITGKQDNISLTTTGTSGPATFISNVLNIPQYAGGVGGTTYAEPFIDQTPDNGTYNLLGGLVNGTNTVYTVSQAVYLIGKLYVFRNGQLMVQGAGANGDWTETNPTTGTFTFNTAPVTTDVITAVYVKNVAGAASVSWGSITGSLASQTDLQTALNAKQDTLVSGTNIKTINGASILGAGNIVISGGGGTVNEIEVDFGLNTQSKSFTITDALITPASKIIAYQSGNTATGRIGDDDAEWDSIIYSAKAGTGQFKLTGYATGRIAGKRKLYYSST